MDTIDFGIQFLINNPFKYFNKLLYVLSFFQGTNNYEVLKYNLKTNQKDDIIKNYYFAVITSLFI